MKFIDTVFHLFSKSDLKRRVFFALSFFILVGPVVTVNYINYRKLNSGLTNSLFSQRESVALLGASLLQEKFDRLSDIGVSFATRIQFRKFVSEGKWDEAMSILQTIPSDFTYVYQVALYDTKGTLTSVYPFASNAVGKNFASRDYYQGVIKEWKPYLSEAFKRQANPSYNVVALAVPIKSETQEPIGIMVLGIKLSTLAEWTKGIEVGKEGLIYFVDKNGHLATDHTNSPLTELGDIADYSSVPAVQKVLAGEAGIGVFINPLQENEKELIAYQPVLKYGWGALVEQPADRAFEARNGILTQMVLVGILLTLIDILFIYILLRVISLINNYRQQDKILLESAGDGILAIDRSWNITLWNKAAGVITGWSEEEALGKPFRDIVKFMRENDKKENIAFIEETMLFGKPHFMEQRTFLARKDGTEIPVSDSAAPVFDEKGQVKGAIIVFRDASKEQDAQRMRSDFAYASHQLRTPVNQALWTLEIAQEAKSSEEMLDSLKIAYLAMQSVQKLADELILVSELDQITIVPKYGLNKLSVVLEDIVKEISVELKVYNIKLIMESIPQDLSFETDAKLLKRILSEILQNAIHYSSVKGEIRIAANKQKDNVLLIEISDLGMGIPESQQALIFTKFFRGNNASPKIPGAGLGLYLAREYAKLLGGKIWFKSEEGKGTTFYISLPLGK